MKEIQLVQAPHILSGVEVCKRYNVDPSKGLTTQQVDEVRNIFGWNELTQREMKTLTQLILTQFEDLLARILLLAAFVSFILAVFSNSNESEGLTGFVEPIVILLILIANACVSIWQESNAEKSLEALKKLQPELAIVLRNNRWTTIQSRELVPGDICEVKVGDKVPADLRVFKLKSISLRVIQSELTGETQAITKETITLPSSQEDCELQSKINMLFSSTTIAHGSAIGIVVCTGMKTEIGIIQSAVQDAEQDPTPLQQKLNEFGELLSKVIGFICLLVWLINFKNFNEPSHGGILRGCVYYFKTAVALAVAAIPEGLTAVITTCLALGTRKMAQKNAIVRRLQSVETLGCTTVICTDKTGTLTTNEMSCVKFIIVASPTEVSTFSVECHNYEPVGIIKSDETHEVYKIRPEDKGIQYFIQCCSLCNESKLFNENNQLKWQGEPTELALKVLVEKFGCLDERLNEAYLKNRECDPSLFNNYWADKFQRIATLEFTRERKSMSVIYKSTQDSSYIHFVKGAPESILERCTHVICRGGNIVPLSKALKEVINLKLNHMTGSMALRVLALAMKLEVDSSLIELSGKNDEDYATPENLEDPDKFIEFENKLIFCGLTGLIDLPRPEVHYAIASCQKAGIKVVMITGDNKQTAEAMAVLVGITRSDDVKKYSFTGKEYERLTDEEKKEVFLKSSGVVFSRTEPKHKQLIIRVLKELNHVVAMTGDGVNDAPALKQADIGISMGRTGTEVAKEASDVVLANDNFMSIVDAIQEGRSIYNNMKAFIRYLISSNIGEVVSIFVTAALGIPEGLVPVQLLWVNLITDGLPATALGFNPPDISVMKKKPRNRNEPLISAWVFLRYLIIGLYVGFATVGIFIYWFTTHMSTTDQHSLVNYYQLSHWTECHQWADFRVKPIYNMNPEDMCSYFNEGKIKASTLSLTVLVVIEMFNALNALSDEHSLLTIPPWSNPWLLCAVGGSILVHLCILHINFLSVLFGVVPLTLNDWIWVIIWSFPVFILDELLKCITRYFNLKQEKPKLKKP